MFNKRSGRSLLVAAAACGAIAAAPASASALTVSLSANNLVLPAITLASLGPTHLCTLTEVPSWIDYMSVQGRNVGSGQHFDDVVLTGSDSFFPLGVGTPAPRDAFVFWGDGTVSAGHIDSSGNSFSVDGAHDYDDFGIYHGAVVVGRPAIQASTSCTTPFSVTVLPQGG